MSRSVHRALDILQLLGEQPRRPAEIARLLHVHASTTTRLLQDMSTHRLVHKGDDGYYRLSGGIIALGFQALDHIDERKLAMKPMEHLNEITGETIHLGVLDGDFVTYVEKRESRHPVRMYSQIGRVAPIHCTGVGKTILAHLAKDEQDRLLKSMTLHRNTPNTITTERALQEELAQVRARGFGTDNEEHETGIVCVAAPIRQADGSVRSSISVTVPTSRMSLDQLLAFRTDLLEAARTTSEGLGWRGSSQDGSSEAGAPSNAVILKETGSQ